MLLYMIVQCEDFLAKNNDLKAVEFSVKKESFVAFYNRIDVHTKIIDHHKTYSMKNTKNPMTKEMKYFISLFDPLRFFYHCNVGLSLPMKVQIVLDDTFKENMLKTFLSKEMILTYRVQTLEHKLPTVSDDASLKKKI